VRRIQITQYRGGKIGREQSCKEKKKEEEENLGCHSPNKAKQAKHGKAEYNQARWTSSSLSKVIW